MPVKSVNTPPLTRNTSIQSNVSVSSRGDIDTGSQTGREDGLERSNSATNNQQEVGTASLQAGLDAPKKPGSFVVSNKVEPSEAHGEAIAAATTKGLSALVREVSTKTSGARAATKYTTIAGIGLAFGLLFAGQPFAVMLVAPAFAALGTVIAYVMRTYQNNKADASIDAFTKMMQEPTEEMKSNPDFAEAQKLNAFLTDSFKTFATKELKGLASGIKNPLAGMAARFEAVKAAREAQQAEGVDEQNVLADVAKPAQHVAPARTESEEAADKPYRDWLNDFSNVRSA